MSALPFTMAQSAPPRLGLVVLQADETVEDEFRRMIPKTASLHVSRVPSGWEVTQDSLGEMEQHLSEAAGLFPYGLSYDVVGYACTSGTARIGANRIAETIRAGTSAKAVTEPVSALIAACKQAEVTRLAFLSPYIESVSTHLRDVLAASGIATPVFGSFEEAEEAKVARIDGVSIASAAKSVMEGADVEALFLSCTNLRSFDMIDDLQHHFERPVFSSNLVLAWHMQQLAGVLPLSAKPQDLLG